MTRDVYEEDTGLAAERTELAWGRSVLALFACGAVTVKGLPNVTGVAGRPAAGVVLLVFTVVVWLSGVPYGRVRAAATRSGARRAITAREVAPMALGTAVLGVAAFVIGALLPG